MDVAVYALSNLGGVHLLSRFVSFNFMGSRPPPRAGIPFVLSFVSRTVTCRRHVPVRADPWRRARPAPLLLSTTGTGLSRRKLVICSGALTGRLIRVRRLLFGRGQQIICRNLRINLLRRVRRTRVLRDTRLRAGGALSSSTSRTPRVRAGRDFSSTTTCWRPRRSW